MCKGFVIGLSQIASFFSSNNFEENICKPYANDITEVNPVCDIRPTWASCLAFIAHIYIFGTQGSSALL